MWLDERCRQFYPFPYNECTRFQYLTANTNIAQKAKNIYIGKARGNEEKKSTRKNKKRKYVTSHNVTYYQLFRWRAWRASPLPCLQDHQIAYLLAWKACWVAHMKK